MRGIPPFTGYYAVACLVIWAFLVLFGLNDEAILRAGFWPARGFDLSTSLGPHLAVPAAATPVTSALLHVDMWHVLSNLLFLLLCGGLVEQRIGTLRTVFLGVIGAYGAALGYAYLPLSGGNVTVGASGAISTFVAAAIVLSARPGKVRLGNLSANASQLLILAGLWIAYQLYIAFGTPGGGTVAIGSHIGGFIVGLLLARPIAKTVKLR